MTQEGPGQLVAFQSGDGNKFVQFNFHEEVILNALRVTTFKDFPLKSFLVRALNDLNDPELFSVDDPIVKGRNDVSY